MHDFRPRADWPDSSGSGDDDLVHLNPKIARFAGGASLLAGAIGLLDGVQVLASVTIHSTWAVAPYALAALGATLLALAHGVFRARELHALAALIVSSLLTVAAGVWAVFAMSHGFFAIYAFWAPACGALSVALTAVSLPACERAARARKRLSGQGLNLGR